MLLQLRPEAASGHDALLGKGCQLRGIFRVPRRHACRLPMRIARLIIVRDDGDRQRDQDQDRGDEFDPGPLRGDGEILPAIFVDLHAGKMGWKMGRPMANPIRFRHGDMTAVNESVRSLQAR
jgi:hypothetical protein